ncbi:3-deoxy-manno-octulosonate cytidylyltransferase [Pleionea sp. CnH1-48]|uniref:3-deoxy-manno-octulosonate cytidylyltransferase n=1 Tax=Pleionea sp. CnH1-48 TaxID=2954494 RepID=UPI00209836D2|nr:3-deoxy-manno-octulosonate cytidylyltransferase [Pleionea sp. CnH1-48]MCO7225855.1 3-deoxy-manno-octulosonate cytidylyltransferase [Pleionea sp. CnH1-48]
MTFHVIIPARYASSRLPGKPLAMIGDKPMIQWVYEQAQASGAQSVAVATDDQRVYDAVLDFGGVAVMTRDDHESGTDRIHEACQSLGLEESDIVVNVQGDEPFIPPEVISQVAQLMSAPDSVMATLCTPIESEEERTNPNAVKVVFSERGKALYFSRHAIPYDRDQSIDADKLNQHYFRHLGIYAYRRSFLQVFAQLKPSRLESIEKLEQLRVLENGFSIEIGVASEAPLAGVDTADDLETARAYAKKLSS